MPAGQLVDHVTQPLPLLSTSQPEALHVPDGHAAVPGKQLPHAFEVGFHVPEAHSQPAKFAEDVEPGAHWVQPLAGELPTLIGVAWYEPAAHAVQTMSDVAVPAVA